MKDDIKTFRFQFKATIGELFINMPNLSSSISATWRRSSDTVITKPVNMVGGKVNFKQSVDLELNMYFESSKGTFQDKKTMFSFTMHTPKGDKTAGQVYVEVARLLNNKLEMLTETYPLEKCPVKDSNVQITIQAFMIGEGAISDNMSVDSSILNQSAGPSTLSIESKRHIPSSSAILEESPGKQQKSEKTEKSDIKEKVDKSDIKEKVQQIQTKKEELEEKDKIIANLTSQNQKLQKQKQELAKQLQKAKSSEGQSKAGALKQQLIKSKNIQQKLESQINNLRSENIEHERELQKMRIRMEQIYELLFSNLNGLY